ncbi:MAG: FtsX-like permease family protein, partial [Bacteroidota bacterium]
VFGNQDPVGKAMIYQNGEVYLVSGIVKDPPSTSSLQFSHVASLISDPDYKREMEREKWNNHNYFTFFALKEHSDPSVLESKLPEIYNKYSGLDDTYSNKGTYYVQALRDLHLETGMNADLGSKGNIQYIRLFSLVALLILLLACINYTNLAIARSMRRAKEVGIRKTIGARFGQLMGQFLGESVLIAGLSLLFALVLTYFLLPVFGSIMGRSLEIHIQENPFLLLVLLGLVICVGLLAGSYPALVMSSLKPIQVLKGKIRERFSTSSFQKILIIGQYATSIAMIIGSIAIYQQFQFIKRKDLGYEKDHVLSIPISFRDNQLRESLATLKTDWLSHPQIEGVSTSGTLPIYVSSSTTINDDKGSPKDDDLVVYENRVDYDFLDLYNIPLLAGRNFSPDFPTDLEKGYILNETAAKSLGWTAQEAVGKHFTHMGEETVIGVVKDFHIHPMRMEIAPLMMLLNQGFYSFVSIKVRPDNLSQTLDFLKETFQANSPYPFEYSFLDARFNRLYQDDQRLGSILGFFTLLAFLVASLGLFGLAAFSATQRTKEIGIRKVMGATVKHIVRMLSVDFMRLVLVGFLIAIPIAWYAIHTWLEGFAYGIEMKWWVFGLVGLSAMLIAFLTISFQSIKAALMNPLECLVDE